MTAPKPTVMYQIFVRDHQVGHEIPVGPSMDVDQALYPLAEAINLAVAKGLLKDWADAHVKQV